MIRDDKTEKNAKKLQMVQNQQCVKMVKGNHSFAVLLNRVNIETTVSCGEEQFYTSCIRTKC